MPDATERRAFRIRGIVEGVGFRPFLYARPPLPTGRLRPQRLGGRETFDRRHAYRMERRLPTWERTLESLLARAARAPEAA